MFGEKGAENRHQSIAGFGTPGLCLNCLARGLSALKCCGEDAYKDTEEGFRDVWDLPRQGLEFRVDEGSCLLDVEMRLGL